MRAKILRYLILRYGEEPPAPSEPRGGSRPQPLFLEFPVGPERPLKSPELIRSLLEQIRRLA